MSAAPATGYGDGSPTITTHTNTHTHTHTHTVTKALQQTYWSQYPFKVKEVLLKCNTSACCFLLSHFRVRLVPATLIILPCVLAPFFKRKERREKIGREEEKT